MSKDLERLKQHFPLLEYLQRHHWTGRPVGNGSEFVGLCPLHEENHPSFYVNPHKNLLKTRPVNKPLEPSLSACTAPVSPRVSFTFLPARIPTVSSWPERAATTLSVAWRRLSPHDFSTHSAELFSAERLTLSVARRARP
jgi:hypothetical protein